MCGTRRTGLPLRVGLSVSLSFLAGFAGLALDPRSLVEVYSFASLCEAHLMSGARGPDEGDVLFRMRGMTYGESKSEWVRGKNTSPRSQT
jgi:hypothetical protein